MLSIFNGLRGMTFFPILFRMVMGFIAGGVIGLERSYKNKSAGFRTHILVCIGAVVASMTGQYLYLVLGLSADMSRIPTQVISGISFIGAGTIVVTRNKTVKGLTTAAGIWATSAIGLAIGGGMYYIGLFGTVLIAVLQFIMHKFKIGSDAPATRITLEVTDNQGFAPQLSEAISHWHAKPTETKIVVDEDGSAKYDITLRSTESISPEEFMAQFSANERVKNIAFITSE